MLVPGILKAVIDLAARQGLKSEGTHWNRMVADIARAMGKRVMRLAHGQSSKEACKPG